MDVDEGYGMVGRDDQMDEFWKIWEKGDRRIVVIHGPKLVGKSTFVKYFFDKYSKHDKVIRFDFNMIKNMEEFEYELFCNGNFQEGHTSGCRRVSRCINCVRNLQIKITELGKRRLGRLVFILDNLESMCDDGKERTMGEERTYDLIMRLYILDILKHSPNVSLVIVSTMKHTFARYKVHYVELQELDLHSSSTLLCNVAGHDRCSDKMEIVTKIAKLCGGLPLAIINAGKSKC
ncbi:hypothetical protein FSP39_010117 [Pinctada imbricata]|uniref:AAA+ ATPase domain-containing protein n=1 Tax=Pinctada imbricata TaxID=66713 RepID=A0AA88Y467_PINIB|nr:hypothetical protein FSP39_010117 [Pinctada imbricata]